MIIRCLTWNNCIKSDVELFIIANVVTFDQFVLQKVALSCFSCATVFWFVSQFFGIAGPPAPPATASEI